MNIKLLYVVFFLVTLTRSDDWISEKHNDFTIFYKTADARNEKEYVEIIDNGIKSVESFFANTFQHRFDIYVHPNRQSLDSQWQEDWKMPGFKSECWMVASGVGDKLDMISPKMWDKESCEHSYAEKIKTQRLITHELVHVFHGQLNASKDFNDTENIDWFVEGLATYASGQCDTTRMAEVKKMVLNKQSPATLDDFWKGNLKYGLSGSVVMFIDHKYGRAKLKGLLTFNKKPQILAALNTPEEDLLAEWRKYITAQ
jgi:hypothetical protein